MPSPLLIHAYLNFSGIIKENYFLVGYSTHSNQFNFENELISAINFCAGEEICKFNNLMKNVLLSDQ